MGIGTKQARVYARDLVDTVREPLLVLDEELRVVSASRAFYRQYQHTPEETENRLIFDLGNHQWDIPDLRRLLEEIIPEQDFIEDFQLRHRFETLGEKIMLLNGRRVDHDGKSGLIILAIEDFFEPSMAQRKHIESLEKYRKFVEEINSVVVGFDRNGAITFFNAFSEKLFGYSRHEVVGKSFVGTIIPIVDSKGIDNSRISREVFTDPGKYYTNESEGVCKNGGRIVFCWSAKAVRDNKGKVTEILIDGNDITETVTQRKNAEKLLQRKTAELEATINSIPAGYIIYGLDRGILRMNEVAEDIIGFTKEEWNLSYENRIKLLGVLTPEGEPFPIERIPSNRAFKGETVRNVIMKIVRPNRHYWLSVSAAPIIAGDGGMLGVVMEFADITERKQAEEQVEKTRKRYHLVNRATHDIIWDWDLTNDRLEWNEAVESAVGCRRCSMSPTIESWYQHIHPQDRDHVVEQIHRAIDAGESVWSAEYRFGPVGGPYREYLDRGMIARDENGKAYRMIGSMLDLTERKRTERALRDSEEKFRAVFEQAAVGIGRVSFHDARWIDVNTVFCRMLDYSAEEFKATPWPEITHPNDIDLDLIPFKRMAAGELDSYSVEKRFIHRKGYYVWARLTLSLVRDEQGRPDFEIAIIEDINERKQAVERLHESEERFRTLAEELAAANRDLESFSFSVSHDLRNPLQTIGSFAQILTDSYTGRLDEDGREFLRRIDEGVKKMKRLIDDMLSLSRISEVEMDLQDVNLSSVVRDYLHELSRMEPKRRAELVVEENVHAGADPRLIHLALENLLRNAWKFTIREEITRIEFGILRGNDKTVYFIRDNGAGFDMQFADKIFEPFKRGHGEKEFGGTGVGLSIVQRVIGRHGGTVWAEGEPGEGAVFYFTLQ